MLGDRQPHAGGGERVPRKVGHRGRGRHVGGERLARVPVGPRGGRRLGRGEPHGHGAARPGILYGSPVQRARAEAGPRRHAYARRVDGRRIHVLVERELEPRRAQVEPMRAGGCGEQPRRLRVRRQRYSQVRRPGERVARRVGERPLGGVDAQLPGAGQARRRADVLGREAHDDGVGGGRGEDDGGGPAKLRPVAAREVRKRDGVRVGRRRVDVLVERKRQRAGREVQEGRVGACKRGRAVVGAHDDPDALRGRRRVARRVGERPRRGVERGRPGGVTDGQRDGRLLRRRQGERRVVAAACAGGGCIRGPRARPHDQRACPRGRDGEAHP